MVGFEGRCVLSSKAWTGSSTVPRGASSVPLVHHSVQEDLLDRLDHSGSLLSLDNSFFLWVGLRSSIAKSSTFNFLMNKLWDDKWVIFVEWVFLLFSKFYFNFKYFDCNFEFWLLVGTLMRLRKPLFFQNHIMNMFCIQVICINKFFLF